METPTYNFAEGKAKCRAATDLELEWALCDLNITIAIQEESVRAGFSCPKLGYYHDERHTVAAELRWRQRANPVVVR